MARTVIPFPALGRRSPCPERLRRHEALERLTDRLLDPELYASEASSPERGARAAAWILGGVVLGAFTAGALFCS